MIRGSYPMHRPFSTGGEMSVLTDRLEANRNVTEAFVRAMDGVGEGWLTPRAPGKWTPSQLVEHVARSLEEGGHVVTGAPTRLPTVPAPFRPLLRIFFNRVVRKGAFPKAKTNAKMNPDSGPEDLESAQARVQAALTEFENSCTSWGDEYMTSSAFGRVRLADYVRFVELHTSTHLSQMPGQS
jgi:hypothetical protein